jgi:TM2 domain-containing membrane protein YozV
MPAVAPDMLPAQTQAQSAYDDAKKSAGLAYALWFFLGGVGGHRFYMRSTGIGVAMLLTLGGFGIWTLIDVFFLGRRLQNVNREIKEQIFARHGVPLFQG